MSADALHLLDSKHGDHQVAARKAALLYRVADLGPAISAIGAHDGLVGLGVKLGNETITSIKESGSVCLVCLLETSLDEKGAEKKACPGHDVARSEEQAVGEAAPVALADALRACMRQRGRSVMHVALVRSEDFSRLGS